MCQGICLSASGIKQAASLDENRFTFIVGKEELKFECSRLQACFLSKKVCNLLVADSTLDRLIVLPDRTCSCFNLIERLWNGCTITIDDSNTDELIALSRELENDELCRLVHSNLLDATISTENCISVLHVKQSMSFDIQNEIKFIASNFFKLDTRALMSLTIGEFEEILNHDALKLENENRLLDMIAALAEKNEEYYSLFKYVHFEYLDVGHITTFMEALYPHRIDYVIWESIIQFITRNAKTHSSNKRFVPQGELFEYNVASPLDGIFCYLGNIVGGNPHIKGLVTVKANPVGDLNNSFYQVIDANRAGYISTNDEPNSYVQFDFKDMRVLPTSYTIRTYNCESGAAHLKQWEIQCSNDCSNWVVIDARDTDSLNGTTRTKNFVCTTPPTEGYRYIRITLTGPNWCGNNRLLLRQIEFFGYLFEDADEYV